MMLLFRVLCFLTLLLSVASVCSSADTISSTTEDRASCTEVSDGADGKCNKPTSVDSVSDDDPCKTVSDGLAEGSCPTTPTTAGTHGVAGSGTVNTSQVSDPGDGAGLAGRGEQQHLERQERQLGDAVSESPGTLTGVSQVGSQPVLSVPENKDGRHDNGQIGDPGMSAEGSPTGQVISGETDHTNGTQQPGGNGSQSSESSGAANTDTRDSPSNQTDTTEQPQSSDNNQTSQEQNGEADNANGAANPAEDESTKDTDNTTNNEESTTTTTTTTLPPELTNNKKGDADSSNSSISSSVWVRVPLLI
ncbi:uncharacterized protein TM35_000511020, partial [Trypanosoma theileri]